MRSWTSVCDHPAYGLMSAGAAGTMSPASVVTDPGTGLPRFNVGRGRSMT